MDERIREVDRHPGSRQLGAPKTCLQPQALLRRSAEQPCVVLVEPFEQREVQTWEVEVYLLILSDQGADRKSSGSANRAFTHTRTWHSVATERARERHI